MDELKKIGLATEFQFYFILFFLFKEFRVGPTVGGHLSVGLLGSINLDGPYLPIKSKVHLSIIT